MNTSSFSICNFIGLMIIAAMGCAPDKDSASETETSSATETGTETGTETVTETEAEPEPEPEQSMPSQGFWGHTRTYDDRTGATQPISREICAATAEQLDDPQNPPAPEDMICVTSSADGSYAIELEAGSYGLCAVSCNFDCIFEITEGLVVERNWEAGPGGGFFEPMCSG